MQNVNKIKVEDNQSIWDIAVQEYGNPECIWQLVDDNPSVITSLNVKLVPGSYLNVQKDKSVVNGYRPEVAKAVGLSGAQPAMEFHEPTLPSSNIIGWYKAYAPNSFSEEEGKNTIDTSEGVSTFSRLFDFSGNGNHLVQGRKENQPGIVPFEGRYWADMFGEVKKYMEVTVGFSIPIYVAAIIRVEPDYGEVRNGYLIAIADNSGPQGVQVTNQSVTVNVNTTVNPCGYMAMPAYDEAGKVLVVLLELAVWTIVIYQMRRYWNLQYFQEK